MINDPAHKDSCQETRAEQEAEINGTMDEFISEESQGANQATRAAAQHVQQFEKNFWRNKIAYPFYFDKEYIDLVAELEALTAEKEAKDAKIAELDAKAKELDAKIAANAAKIAELEAKEAELEAQIAAAAAAAALPKVPAPQVKSLLVDNSKPTGLFFGAIEDKRITEGLTKVELTPNSKTESIVIIGMECINSMTTTSQELNEFDYAVLDAVNTLHSQGYPYFGLENIFRVLARDNNAQLMPGYEMERNIKESLTRLESTKISIDASNISNKYNIDRETIEVLKVESRMLQFEKATVLVNGQRAVDWYHLLQEPKLFTLAKRLKQVKSIPLAGLKTKNSVTEDSVKLQQYLLRRCIGAGRGMSPKILLNAILKQAGITIKTDDRKKRQRIIGMIKNILDDWTKAGDIISGYTIEAGKTKNSVIAFIVQPPKINEQI